MTNYVFNLRASTVHGIKFKNSEVTKEFVISYRKRIDTNHVDLSEALSIIYKILSNNPDGEDFNLGISIPGVINSKDKKVVTESLFKNVSIDFNEYFKNIKHLKRLEIINDGNAELLGEYYYGSASQYKNVFMISIAFAMAGALILDGKLRVGKHSRAAEFSKMYADIAKNEIFSSESSIYCGNMQARYRLALAKNIDINDMDWSKFLELFIQNDTNALEVVDIWTSSIAKQIININLVTDVDAVIIGNNGTTFKVFTDKVREKVLQYSEKVKLGSPSIMPGELGKRASLYGLLAILEGKWNYE